MASARDRQRLREKQAAERGRVERMLANVPLQGDPEPAVRRSVGPRASRAFSPPGLRVVGPAVCPVCGDSRIVSDEVVHLGTLRLSECLRCEHRWTERPLRRFAELGSRMVARMDPVGTPPLQSV